MTADDLDPLFEVLCLDWGFCLSAEAVEAIAATPGLTPRLFADLVLAAEGGAGPAADRWRERIASRFERFSGVGPGADEA